jgi:hypothetical protein
VTRGDHQASIEALCRKMEEGETKTNGYRTYAGRQAHAIFRSDAEIINTCRSLNGAEKFATLFDDGDADAYHGGNRSSADYALIAKLRFYTQDASQIERVMYDSALRRPKWDETRGGKTWLRSSIDKALREDFDTYLWPSEKVTHTANFDSSEYKNGVRMNRNRCLSFAPDATL